MAGSRGAATPALRALAAAGVPHSVHAYERSTSGTAAAAAAGGYGAEAAAALGTDPARVLKTLVVTVDGDLAVVVVPVGGRVDLRAAAAALGGRRASMADPERAQRSTGYVVGGISPLGQRRALRTVLDAAAAAHPTVLVSAGQRGLDVELAPADLVRLTGAVVAPVAAGQPG